MAIATTMNLNTVDITANTNTNTEKQQEQQEDHQEDDEHEHDMVMPGFRFHPTEEELIEFYLRRKVEGKRFNVELITFLDLYRYDPWELPALAAIGEKEWFFYVPRDRKYRNGDRPNRVTTSGYWKATGADRMIRGENLRPIGLKKTLVFYSGKAPKGIRTSWIMNEYRLPQHETERYQKAEISLCRVYKRAGVEDNPPAPPRGMASRLSSSSFERKNHQSAFRAQSSSLQHHHQHHHQHQVMDKVSETDASSSTDVGTTLGLSHHNSYTVVSPLATSALAPVPSPAPSLAPAPHQPPVLEVDRMMNMLHHQQTLQNHQHGECGGSLLLEGRNNNLIASPIFLGNSSSNTSNHHHNQFHQPSLEEIQRLVEYQQSYFNHHFQQHHHQHSENQQQQQLQFEALTSNQSSNTTTAITTTTNSATNSPFMFSNYLFSSPSQQQQPLLNNPPPIVGGSIGLHPPVTTAAGGGGGGGGAGAAFWEWNPFPEPNRDHFSNLFK
ncbi:hypothetical protein RND81_02G173000 [Saponaria officinalis]|uniref:NAC domain-containing protein n=1 Tax=Saponaria officinalis TaxID=3572 RepID=A0AAW1MYP5_SAPOF